VIVGNRQGTRLGFPTANVALATAHAGGVYAGRVTVDGKDYDAALYVGKNTRILEAHLLGFDGDLYGKTIEGVVVKKIRARWDFKTEADLIAQIERDIVAIKNVLKPKT